MSNSKMQLNNTNSNSNNVNMNNGNQKLSQWQQQQQQQQQQQPLANYTLPGVINYLTSEFTDLERFKIMTNLEKSEMKYKIVQLQGELNSLKYMNEKQKSRIRILEKENRKLRGQLGQDDGESKPEGDTKKEGSAEERRIDIPEVDLLEIQKSRTQLTKSMKQVLHLLKAPHANNINAMNYPMDQLNEYDALTNNNKIDNFFFSEKSNPDVQSGAKGRKYNKDSIFSQYLNDIPFKSQNVKSDEDFFKISDQNDISEIGDINAKSIQYLTLSAEEKEPFPSANYKGDESDAETVIMDESDNKLELTKTKSNHAKSPENDSLSKLTSSMESKVSLDEAFPMKPKAFITTNDPDYEHCRFFANCLNNILVYMNYDNKLDHKLISLNIWSTLLNKLIVSKELSDSIIENPNNIIDIYCLSHDEANMDFYLLIIYKSGVIDQIKLNENSQITKTCIINIASVLLNSSKLIEFSHKTSPKSRNFGLVVTGVQKAGSGPFIKIYDLLTDTSRSVVETEIGSYVKSFFKLPNLQDSDTFEVVHWFKNDETAAETASTPSNKIKSHKRTVSCNDVSLSPYEIILKLGHQLIRFNMVLKKFCPLVEDLLTSFTQEVCFNDHLALFAEISENDSKLKVYDLNKKQFLSETNFRNSLSDNLSLILVSDQSSHKIARLDRTHIQFYDLCFSLLHHINISPLPNTLLYANHNVILASMSKDSIENFSIYDLNTITV